MAKKKPRHIVLYTLFRVLSVFIFILPIKLGLKAGQCFGRIAFYLLRSPKEIALNNLDIAFGSSKSVEEKEFITRSVFENMAKNFVEVVSLTKFNKSNIDSYIQCKGLYVIERLIEEGKGCIVLSAHLGNWELLAHYFAIKGFSVNVMARRLRMQYFEGFLDRIRRRNRVNVLYRDSSAKEALELLKKGEFIGIMPDQDIDSVSGVFVDFFGKPAYTPNGPAILNILTGAPVIPCFIARKRFGHEILIEEPVSLSATGDREKDILDNTQRFTSAIENYIRRFPSQWVWFHERWKTMPEDERLCKV